LSKGSKTKYSAREWEYFGGEAACISLDRDRETLASQLLGSTNRILVEMPCQLELGSRPKIAVFSKGDVALSWHLLSCARPMRGSVGGGDVSDGGDVSTGW